MEQTTEVVDFMPIIDELASFLIVCLTALVVFGINWVRGKIGLDKMAQDDMFRKYLEDTIAHAIRFAIAKVPSSVEMDSRAAIVAETVKYILSSVPDAVKHFGLTEDKLAQMVESRLDSASPEPKKDG